jgi:sec-independent protein translocase protein TatA
MGAFSIWHWIIVLAIVLILFARPGKISGIMGDFGKGLRNFKTGMKDDAQDDESLDDDDDDDEHIEMIEVKPVKKKKAAKKAARKAKVKR